MSCPPRALEATSPVVFYDEDSLADDALDAVTTAIVDVLMMEAQVEFEDVSWDPPTPQQRAKTEALERKVAAARAELERAQKLLARSPPPRPKRPSSRKRRSGSAAPRSGGATPPRSRSDEGGASAPRVLFVEPPSAHFEAEDAVQEACDVDVDLPVDESDREDSGYVPRTPPRGPALAEGLDDHARTPFALSPEAYDGWMDDDKRSSKLINFELEVPPPRPIEFAIETDSDDDGDGGGAAARATGAAPAAAHVDLDESGSASSHQTAEPPSPADPAGDAAPAAADEPAAAPAAPAPPTQHHIVFAVEEDEADDWADLDGGDADGDDARDAPGLLPPGGARAAPGADDADDAPGETVDADGVRHVRLVDIADGGVGKDGGDDVDEPRSLWNLVVCNFDASDAGADDHVVTR